MRREPELKFHSYRPRQYREKFSTWGLGKSTPKSVMRGAIKKALQKPTRRLFTFKGQPIPKQNMDRYRQRHPSVVKDKSPAPCKLIYEVDMTRPNHCIIATPSQIDWLSDNETIPSRAQDALLSSMARMTRPEASVDDIMDLSFAGPICTTNKSKPSTHSSILQILEEGRILGPTPMPLSHTINPQEPSLKPSATSMKDSESSMTPEHEKRKDLDEEEPGTKESETEALDGKGGSEEDLQCSEPVLKGIWARAVAAYCAHQKKTSHEKSLENQALQATIETLFTFDNASLDVRRIAVSAVVGDARRPIRESENVGTSANAHRLGRNLGQVATGNTTASQPGQEQLTLVHTRRPREERTYWYCCNCGNGPSLLVLNPACVYNPFGTICSHKYCRYCTMKKC
jgi:hypothetical protein